LIGCSSTLVVTYGDIVVNEAYSLTINPGGQSTTVVCLSNDPDDEPLPEWIECDANGFEVTGENAEGTTISVTVVPLSTQAALIPSALVPLIVDETLEPNGPDCEPVCYRRVGVVAGA
jgi:trehalose-6-phosphatase